MRPTEERSTYGYWDGDDRPDPLVAQSAPEFVTQLRALVRWSGLSLDEIEQLARANGDILPPSIVSAALSHNTLPPEEVVVALVAAIGDDDEMVELWASVLWRLEDEEAATTVTPAVAPHSAPLPPPPVSSVTGSAGRSREYSGGSLAQAVKSRQNQSSWTGLHRGFQKGLRATGLGSQLGRWALPGAIGATVLVLIAGVTWALTGGGEGDDVTEPRANPCCLGETGVATPSAGPSVELLPSDLTGVLPLPGVSTKASPTPRVTPTSRNTPTPGQTQTQPQQPPPPPNPSLSRSGGSAPCTDNGTDWVVNLTVNVSLTGAPAGENPQGRAGKPGDPGNMDVSGGGTSFTGHATITIGVNTAAATGSIEWSVTVNVPGSGPEEAGGAEPYSCGTGT